MKIYHYSANNGDWNGYHVFFVVGKSAEEIKNGDDYKRWVEHGYEVTTPKELTNEDVLLVLGLYQYKNKINFSYTIEEEV